MSYWRTYVHEVLVNRLGGLNLPRKSVVRLTGHPDMTLDVYRGRKTTTQQQHLYVVLKNLWDDPNTRLAPLICSILNFKYTFISISESVLFS